MKYLFGLILLLLLSGNFGQCANEHGEPNLAAKLTVYRYRLGQIDKNDKPDAAWFFIRNDSQVEQVLIKEGRFRRLKQSSDFITDERGKCYWKTDPAIRGYSLTLRNLRSEKGAWICDLIQHGGSLSEIVFRVVLNEEDGRWRVVSFEIDDSVAG